MDCIERLAELLTEANIPHERRECFGGEQIIVSIGTDTIDAICSQYSYGGDKNLLEIMGGLTDEEYEWDSVRGYLTPEEVFERFNYCYTKGTITYVIENEVYQ